MNTEKVNELIENFYNYFHDIEDYSIKNGLKTLTTTELHIIEAIGTEQLTMNELSDKLRITMGTATVAITKLSEKEFIDRKRSTSDRRKVYVSLSKQGIEALDYHQNFHKNIISNITNTLSDGEMNAFIDVFSKIVLSLEKQLDYAKPVPLSEFAIDSGKLQIIKIKGSPAMQEYFSEKSIVPGVFVSLAKIEEDTLFIEISDGKKLPISIIDAKNIYVIKHN